MKDGRMMKELKKIIFNRNPLLILSYLSKNITGENISSHIAKDLDLAVGSVHQILRQFEKKGIVQSRLLGKTIIYEIDRKSPFVKSFRIFDNLLDLDDLFVQLKPLCRKIILFGSCATGDDTFQSDIDLFIVIDPDERVKAIAIIDDFESSREINPIIVDTVELMEMEKNDRVFYNEVMKGIEIK
jgi:predicted nucleotidyltransferase/predicted DNA-binding transcriptional regulator